MVNCELFSHNQFATSPTRPKFGFRT